MEITRHFTATTIIVYQNKVLLHLHKKLGIWIPVGGHIDRDELPEDTAIREIKEETGLTVKLYQPNTQPPMANVRELLRPAYLLLENINQFHQHIDFIYYATAQTDELHPQDGETAVLKWLTAEEINNLEGAPENVKVMSLEALALLSS